MKNHIEVKHSVHLYKWTWKCQQTHNKSQISIVFFLAHTKTKKITIYRVHRLMKSWTVFTTKTLNDYDRLGVNSAAFASPIFQLYGCSGTGSNQKASSCATFRTGCCTYTSLVDRTFATRWSASVHMLLHTREFLSFPK